METRTCPSVDNLKAFLRGQVDEYQLASLSEHLDACMPCQEKAQTLTPQETLLEPASGSFDQADALAAQVPSSLLEKLKNLPRTCIETEDGTTVDNSVPSGPADYDFLTPGQNADEIGRLGRYHILGTLGRGGMGMVFLAHDPDLDRPVAVKVMLPRFAANEAAKQRFLREARAAARLRSDHIVNIYQVGEENGVPYLAMELLEGTSLDHRLRQNPSHPIAEILRIGREIALGLAAAHEKGLIHRDIKPANLWLDENHGGRVKILDFGLARSEKDHAHITDSGMIVGTPAYMAPEQARGDKAVDARADLFSLGCVLYRLCVGDIPFRSETTMGTLLAITTVEPPSPGSLNPQIPTPLSEYTMQLLAKDPARRPASAREVAERLKQMEAELSLPLGTTQTRERPVETAMKSEPHNRRASTVALAGVLFGGLLVLTGLVFFWQTQDGSVVRIESNDPTIKIAFDEGELKIVGAYKEPLSLKPGKHGLKIQRGDFEFETDRLVVNRGEKIALRIEVLAGKVQVVQEGKGVLGSKGLPEPVAKETPKKELPPDKEGSTGKTSTEPIVKKSEEYALLFHGATEGIKLPGHLDFSQPFTVEAFILPMSHRPGGMVLENHTIGLAAQGEQISAVIWQREGKVDNVGLHAKRKFDQFVHLAAVSTGERFRLFIDGKLAEEKSLKLSIPKDPNGLRLGTNFTGLMHGVRISRVARYEKEFTPNANYKPDADTVALYRCDEGESFKLLDSSGNGHHTRLKNATWAYRDGSMVSPPPYLALAFDGVKTEAGYPRVEFPEHDFTGQTGVTMEGYVLCEPTTDAVTGQQPIFGVQGQLTIGFDGKTRELVVESAGNDKAIVHKLSEKKRWRHLAAVRAGEQSYLFVDGKKVGECSHPAIPLKKVEGEFFKVGGGAFQGRIREVKVSAAQLYTGNFIPYPELFLGFESRFRDVDLFRFNTGLGTQIKNARNGKREGKIIGARWASADITSRSVPVGHVLFFEGKGAVALPVKINLSMPFTLEGYFAPDGFPDGFGKDYYKDHYKVGNLLRSSRGGGINFSANDSWSGNLPTRSPSGANTGKAFQHPLLPGQFVHAALVSTGEELLFFLNGHLAETIPFGEEKGIFLTTELSLCDGFLGKATQVRISSVARYRKNFTPDLRFTSDKDTLGLYHFDEGEGDVLRDSSGNGQHGKIRDGKWIKLEGSAPPDAPKKTGSLHWPSHAPPWAGIASISANMILRQETRPYSLGGAGLCGASNAFAPFVLTLRM